MTSGERTSVIHVLLDTIGGVVRIAANLIDYRRNPDIRHHVVWGKPSAL